MGEPGKSYLRAKIQIGNARGGTNFAPNQTVFHHDDISEEKRKRVQEVKKFARPNVAGNNDIDWNPSSKVNSKLVERRTRENFVFDRSNTYQYNYRAETLPNPNPTPEDKPSKFRVTLRDTGKSSVSGTTNFESTNLKRTQELPIHPNLQTDFTTEWNLSSAIQKSNFDKSFNDLNRSAKHNTTVKTQKLVKDDTYISPFRRSEMIQEEVRRQKAEGRFNVQSNIFQQEEEPVDRRTLVNQAAIEPSLKFTTTKHTGVWEYNKQEGRHMWSDTGSFDYNSRGDAVFVHNPDGYNYAKPNLTKTRQR